ncbi:unnamed protein product [Leptosia nina]|uniref:G-protein coupled receptors family 1 profile domain-containing protein n=1 Tax=Leptosia nina TaxID=320188 RepID=A0AAV1JTX3_9NEOP
MECRVSFKGKTEFSWKRELLGIALLGLQPNTMENEARESEKKQYCLRNQEFSHVVRSTHIDKSIEAKRKVIRMLFVIILEFFVCWTPLHAINTIYLFYPEELYRYVGSKGIISLQLLAYCSSCCNPITYCFMNRKFRHAFITLFKTCKLVRWCFPEKSEGKQVTPPPSSQDVTACVTWTDKKARIVFSSGSQTTTVGSVRTVQPVGASARPVTQVIETGEEGSQFLYRITWPRTQPKQQGSSQPLYE